MESPIKTHQHLEHIDGIKDIAYQRLFENYLKLDLKGPQKKVSIESTDQESLLNLFRRNQPYEGMIYTFIHLNQTNLNEIQNLKTGKPLQFHDITPIVFCTSFNAPQKLLKGLNLNMLPNLERLKFLEAYYNLYKDFLKDIEELTEYDKVAINYNYHIAALTGKNPEIFKKFNHDQNAVFEFAYRAYDMRNLRQFRMIEYEEWKYIPFFDAKQSFKKANLEMIYKTYYDNKSKTNLT
jgi:hypothetical protein